MAIRREATTWFRSVFVEAVIPPPCPPCSVLHSAPWAPSYSDLGCLLFRAQMRMTPPRSHLPWPATSKDTEQISPDKTGSGYCANATFTPSPGSQDFAVLCQLVPGK